MSKRVKGRNILLGLVVAVVLIVLLIYSSQYSELLTSPTQTSPTDSGVKIGEVGFLSVDNRSNLAVVFSSLQVYKEFLKARNRNDEQGMNLILGTDLVFDVKNGIRVQVLDGDWATSSRKIRILEGKEAGSIGVVPEKWIKK